MYLSKDKSRRLAYLGATVCLAVALLYFSLGTLLATLGGFLVINDNPTSSEAVVVLSTGIEYYPRLQQAVRLFREGYVEKVVINGNRKTELLRDLEKKGFTPCCPWYENSLRILSLLGVPRDRVLAISAEDAYDTVSELYVVGRELIREGIKSIVITTSKSHTRRAQYIWEHNFPDQFSIQTVAARTDPYSPTGWWKEGRQIRWVLAEYGAWLTIFGNKGWSQTSLTRRLARRVWRLGGNKLPDGFKGGGVGFQDGNLWRFVLGASYARIPRKWTLGYWS